MLLQQLKPTNLLAFLYILNKVRAQIPNDPQSYQPHYNPQYTNTQQNPQAGTTPFDNPLLTSIQDQQQMDGNTNTLAGGSGQANYNNYFDSQSNLNRPLSTNSFSSFDSQSNIENEDLHDNRFLVKDSFNDFNNQNRNQNPIRYYNTIGSSANRNQNNLKGFIGKTIPNHADHRYNFNINTLLIVTLLTFMYICLMF